MALADGTAQVQEVALAIEQSAVHLRAQQRLGVVLARDLQAAGK